MSTIIQTNQLTKSYGRSRGIIDVTFDIQEGEVFGFLGPNGAGKTTTMRTLMGLLHANSGSATIGGLDCWTQSTEVKKLVGYLPGEFAFDPGLRGAQIIEYLGHLRGGVDQAYLHSLVERLGFDPSKRFREYSHGNKQKCDLCADPGLEVGRGPGKRAPGTHFGHSELAVTHPAGTLRRKCPGGPAGSYPDLVRCPDWGTARPSRR